MCFFNVWTEPTFSTMAMRSAAQGGEQCWVRDNMISTANFLTATSPSESTWHRWGSTTLLIRSSWTYNIHTVTYYPGSTCINNKLAMLSKRVILNNSKLTCHPLQFYFDSSSYCRLHLRQVFDNYYTIIWL